MTKEMFKLGQRLRCRISGFEGIATTRIEYLNGCVQYCLQPSVDKEGKAVEGEYFDQGQLILVDEGVCTPPKRIKTESTGGPVMGNPPTKYGG